MDRIYEVGHPNKKFVVEVSVHKPHLWKYQYEMYEMSWELVKELLDTIETLEGMEG